jgi:5-(carboxyamino)imidazole ribonucleotide synthase
MRWSSWLNDPNACLHLYGKKEVRAGRKMGHVTVLGREIT